MTQSKSKVILTFGCLSGLVSAALMGATIPFMEDISFDKGLIVGYTGMVISFLFVFFGVRSYRQSLDGARLTFGNAFLVGLLITLISCVFYVVAWEVLSSYFMPDFMEKYTARALEELRASGAAQAVIDVRTREMADFQVMYSKPLIRAAFTFIEPFPVGILVTLVSAVTLRRK